MSDTNDNTPEPTPKEVDTPPEPAPQPKVADEPERVSYDPNGDRYIRTDD